MTDPHTSRRQFLYSVGAGLTAPLATSSQVASFYFTPPAAATQSVIPLTYAGRRWVPTGDWPVHSFGYQTEGDETAAALERVQTGASYTFKLNGTTVSDFHRGWTDTKIDSAERHYHTWEYAVPPLPAGEHSFSLTVEFPSPIRTDGRVWQGTYTFDGTYTVSDSRPATQDTGRQPLDGPINELQQYELDDSELLGQES